MRVRSIDFRLIAERVASDDLRLCIYLINCSWLSTQQGCIIPIRTRFQTVGSTRLAGGWLLMFMMYSSIASVLHYILFKTRLPIAALALSQNGQQ